METNFQFRLNRIIISHIVVRSVVIDGLTDRREIVACGESIGMFAIDDNEDLADAALPKFSLEVKDLSIPPCERRFTPTKNPMDSRNILGQERL